MRSIKFLKYGLAFSASLLLVACDDSSSSNPAASELSSSSSGVDFVVPEANTSSSSVLNSEEISSNVSSSVVISSSSSIAAVPIDVSSSSENSESGLYGILTDLRDGQTYKTVNIDTMVWMAENLNYADSVNMPNLKESSWCYENSMDSCAKYGRLYQWTAVMDLDPKYKTTKWDGETKNRQGICPTGWHVPRNYEWQNLANYAYYNGQSKNEGKTLRMATEWIVESDTAIGKNDLGFSALPAGFRNGGYSVEHNMFDDKLFAFDSSGYRAYWWASNEYCPLNSYYWKMNTSDVYFNNNANFKRRALSVRCVKNSLLCK